MSCFPSGSGLQIAPQSRDTARLAQGLGPPLAPPPPLRTGHGAELCGRPGPCRLGPIPVPGCRLGMHTRVLSSGAGNCTEHRGQELPTC